MNCPCVYDGINYDSLVDYNKLGLASEVFQASKLKKYFRQEWRQNKVHQIGPIVPAVHFTTEVEAELPVHGLINTRRILFSYKHPPEPAKSQSNLTLKH